MQVEDEQATVGKAIMNTFKSVLAVNLLYLLFAASSNFMLQGSISSPKALAGELCFTGEDPAAWTVSTVSPYKYRVIFKWLVDTPYRLLGGDQSPMFYYTYVFESLLCVLAAGIAFFYYLRAYTHSSAVASIGNLLFYICPPLCCAYVFPVHTREDPLAYLLLCLGLLAILKQRTGCYLLLCFVSPLCRETLAVIPFIGMASNFSKPVSLAGLGLALLSGIAVRLGYGFEGYPVFEQGLHYNLANLGETAIFMYIAFGPLWVIGVHRWIERPKTDFMSRSFPIAVLLIAGTCLVLARVREIRLLYLLFPWILSFSAEWLHRYWKDAIQCVVKESVAMIIAMFAFALGAVLFFAFRWRFAAYLGLAAENGWYEIAIIQGVLMAIAVGVVAKIEKAKLAMIPAGSAEPSRETEGARDKGDRWRI